MYRHPPTILIGQTIQSLFVGTQAGIAPIIPTDSLDGGISKSGRKEGRAGPGVRHGGTRQECVCVQGAAAALLHQAAEFVRFWEALSTACFSYCVGSICPLSLLQYMSFILQPLALVPSC